MKKKVVIISRTILPLQAPRSQRATELAKEFARQGFEVTVYAVLGDYDYSSFEKNYNLKVKNIGKMKFATFNSDGKTKASFTNSALSKIFKKSLEFPDIELAFKVVKILENEKDVDLLITVAIPYPIHWGAAYAKKYFIKNNIKTWVADCGDPYMGNKFLRYPFYFKYIEKWFCRKVDYLVIPIEEAKKAYYQEFQHKIKVIPQGFNFNEFEINEKKKVNSIPTFVYAGAFYAGIRDPGQFMEYLCELNFDFKFIVFTKQKQILENYKSLLGNKLEIRDYIPRKELITLISQVDFLVNFENGTEIQSPSKLIDYALSKRPILSVPSSEINKSIIREFLNGDYSNEFIVEDIEQYNILNVTNKFIKLII